MKAERDVIKVGIVTEHHKLVGNIHIVPGGRITDFLSSRAGGNFIPITDVKVFSVGDEKLLMETDFLTVNTNFIVLLYPMGKDRASKEGFKKDA
ncbi:MAG: hypothetical protein KJ593_04215 [Candidatus Omnitrophica bacterium]|nr:hypothetical protein [Candidatus Omnitrophota bacterium]